MFDQDKGAQGGYDSAVDEDSQPFYMKLFNKNKVEVATLKCYELQPLKSLRDQIVSQSSPSVPNHHDVDSKTQDSSLITWGCP